MTKGAATFLAADFNSAAGVISLDYTNGQKASSLVPGFLSSADWTTFNSKQSALTFGNLTAGSTKISIGGTGAGAVVGAGASVDVVESNLTLSNMSGTLGVTHGGTGTSTTFTAGSVIFAGASGVYSEDNTGLFWDDTNKFLGIGNATPNAGIDIVGSGNPFKHGFTIRDTSLTMPVLTGLGGSFSTTPCPIFSMGISSSVTGGANIYGISTSSAGTNLPLILNGVFGGTGAPPGAVIVLRGGKWNGSTSVQTLAAAERLLEVRNWTTTDLLVMIGDGSMSLGSYPNASAKLQADSTTKGFLPPRMTTTQKNAISSPATGLVVFDTSLAKLCVYTGAAWETVTSV